jgi:hypothetical protein
MAGSAAARVLRPSTAAALQDEKKPLAHVLPFAGRRKPLEEQICSRPSAQSAQIISFPLNSPKEQPSVRPNAQVIPFPARDIKPRQGKSNDAEICQAIKMATVREAKAKGQFTRKSEEALNINYQLAWLVWFRYVEIMLTMGIKVSEFLRRVDFHDQMKRGR